MAQRLGGDPSVTLDDARSVQNDVFSRAAERLVPRLLHAADSLAGSLPAPVRAALDTLRGWDYRCVRDRVAPTLFRAWLGAFLARSALADVPGLAAAALGGRAPEALRDPRTGAPERAATAAVAALGEALAELERLLGPARSSWTWGRAHRARFLHALAWRDSAFNPPTIAIDGDNSTPSVGPSRLPRDPRVIFGPSWRHLVDLAVTDSSLAIVPPGNGGTPEHRLDHLERWANHRYVPLYLDWGHIDAAKESRWRLVPRGSRR
jgi:penicillin amidase